MQVFLYMNWIDLVCSTTNLRMDLDSQAQIYGLTWIYLGFRKCFQQRDHRCFTKVQEPVAVHNGSTAQSRASAEIPEWRFEWGNTLWQS